MTDYSKLSDREIDRLVLNVIYGIHANDKDIQGVWARGGFKYTTNASEVWCIIVENEIDIQFRGSMPDAIPMAKNGNYYSVNKNPLRAAMIVFLMMQENKQ